MDEHARINPEIIARMKAMADTKPLSYRHRYGLKRKKAEVARLGGKCLRCGFTPQCDLDYAALDLHHPEPSLKGTGSEAERQSLQLICSNCHRITHAGTHSRPRAPEYIRNPDPPNHRTEWLRTYYLRKHNASR